MITKNLPMSLLKKNHIFHQFNSSNSIERFHMTSHIGVKKWLTKTCNLCWKGMGQAPTLGAILKTNEKF